MSAGQSYAYLGQVYRDFHLHSFQRVEERVLVLAASDLSHEEFARRDA